MCKEKAAISQLEALGWVWVDDARWDKPKPRVYADPKDMLYEVQQNMGWVAQMELAGHSCPDGPYTPRAAYAKAKVAAQFYPELGYLQDERGWYRPERDKPAHLPGVEDYGIIMKHEG